MLHKPSEAILVLGAKCFRWRVLGRSIRGRQWEILVKLSLQHLCVETLQVQAKPLAKRPTAVPSVPSRRLGLPSSREIVRVRKLAAFVFENLGGCVFLLPCQVAR